MKQLTTILCLLSLLTPCIELYAVQGRVIQVSRKLAMSAEEIQTPREVFINLGSKDGVNIGDPFRVLRAVAVIDEMDGNLRELMSVELGRIEVISVSDYTSIGRVQREKTPREMPKINYPVIMVGDRVEPYGNTITVSDLHQG